MKLTKVADLLQASVLGGVDYLDKEIDTCCGADLMSDVLAFTKHNTLLCTGLTNLQVIRTANMTDLAGIVLVRGKRASLDFILEAEEGKLPVLSTRYTLFEACGILYSAGLKGCSREVQS